MKTQQIFIILIFRKTFKFPTLSHWFGSFPIKTCLLIVIFKRTRKLDKLYSHWLRDDPHFTEEDTKLWKLKGLAKSHTVNEDRICIRVSILSPGSALPPLHCSPFTQSHLLSSHSLNKSLHLLQSLVSGFAGFSLY